jgi:hypothetical protein
MDRASGINSSEQKPAESTTHGWVPDGWQKTQCCDSNEIQECTIVDMLSTDQQRLEQSIVS